MRRSIDRKVLDCFILSLTMAVSPASAKELFYASFDKGLDADHAQGNREVRIIGEAKITTGNQGHGSETEKQSEALDAGYSTNQIAALAYSTKGNINPLHGTIEMWIKTNYDWNYKDSFWDGKDNSVFFWYHG